MIWFEFDFRNGSLYRKPDVVTHAESSNNLPWQRHSKRHLNVQALYWIWFVANQNGGARLVATFRHAEVSHGLPTCWEFQTNYLPVSQIHQHLPSSGQEPEFKDRRNSGADSKIWTSTACCRVIVRVRRVLQDFVLNTQCNIYQNELETALRHRIWHKLLKPRE